MFYVFHIKLSKIWFIHHVLIIITQPVNFHQHVFLLPTSVKQNFSNIFLATVGLSNRAGNVWCLEYFCNKKHIQGRLRILFDKKIYDWWQTGILINHLKPIYYIILHYINIYMSNSILQNLIEYRKRTRK